MPEPSSALTAAAHHGRIDADGADRRRRVGKAEAPRRCRRAAAGVALAQRRWTRPGVSSPASVVRSMQVNAFTSQAACYSFFTVRRVPRVAARRSAAEVLTSVASNQEVSRRMPSLRAQGAMGGYIEPAASSRAGRPKGMVRRRRAPGLGGRRPLVNAGHVGSRRGAGGLWLCRSRGLPARADRRLVMTSLM